MDSKSSGGIGLGGLMAVILVVLKILDKIDLSWFWVITSFIWIPLSFIIFIAFILILIAVIASIFK
jgi:hypothetical protein